MSSSEDENDHKSNSNQTRRRRKVLAKNHESSTNGNKGNSDDECAIYTSLRKVSTNFERKVEQPIGSQATSIILSTRSGDENSQSGSNDFNSICSPPKKVKFEVKCVNDDFDSDEEHQLILNKEQARLQAAREQQQIQATYRDLGKSREALNSSSGELNLSANVFDRLNSALSHVTENDYSENGSVKIIFKYMDKTKSVLASLSDKLEEVLLRTDFTFPSQPSLYTSTSPSQSSELNVIPVANYSRTIKKLGLKHLSIVHCYCVEKTAPTENLQEWFGKVIITFKLNEKQKFQFYSEPSQPLWKTIDEFENSQRGKLNLEGAKYSFDGDLVDVKATPESLDMESGDIIDVYLDSQNGTEVQNNGDVGL